jgi:hypothetical protein
MPKLSLKPVETLLKIIRGALILESKTATGAKKKAVLEDIAKITKLIAQVRPACKKYSVG